jgi:2-hydroxy-3-keto-5-methylthiopentenyl-1-phosphate phosphatase
MLAVKALLVDFDGTACLQDVSRYGALYSDLVFAKDALVTICEQDGVSYRPWETFDQVRAALEESDALAGPVGSERCPGWRIS